MLTACLLFAHPATLTVGDGKDYPRIEAAVQAAKPGDTIEVFPASDAYKGSAVMIRTPDLKIKANGKVVIDGGSFEYSGAGNVPRAILQVDPGADHVTIEGFELKGAHNKSYNGAGVRINQASDVSILDCDIHDNDMGIMSNGDGADPKSASNQLIEHCLIHGNGNLKDPGYNHNLYLGGTSATLRFCDVYRSLTGHNVKSRAHFTLVQYCHIHDSANRECDFVDAWDTERANSNAVLIGDVIEKDPKCPGNRVVIHFGQEKGLRNGTLYVGNCSIHTPFMSGVFSLSSQKAAIDITNSVITNSEQRVPQLIECSNGASPAGVTGWNNWISVGYDVAGTNMDTKSRFTLFPPPQGNQQEFGTYLDDNSKSQQMVSAFMFARPFQWLPVKTPSVGADADEFKRKE